MSTLHTVTAQQLLAPGHFNAFSFGAFLGFEWTTAQKEEANHYARRFFEDLGLLPTRHDIVFCERDLGQPGQPDPCGAIMKSKAAGDRKLGFRWRCQGEGNRRHADTMIEPTTGTIYFHSQLEFRKMLKLVYCWFKKVNVTEAAEECGVTGETACRWFMWWREALSTIAWHDYEKIGGPGDIVEIDETHLFTRKSNVGRVLVSERFWVFGGISRTSGKRFAMRVALRDASTLGAEILDYIAPGSFICTDGWSAYNNINQMPIGSSARFFRGHGVVIHQTNFINPPRGEEPHWLHGFNAECHDRQFVGPHPDPFKGPAQPIRFHIQQCERSWRELKKKVKSTRDFATIDTYIGEYVYLHNILKSFGPDDGAQFKAVLQDILRVYPGPNITPVKANRPGFRMFPAATGLICSCICFCTCLRCFFLYFNFFLLLRCFQPVFPFLSPLLSPFVSIIFHDSLSFLLMFLSVFLLILLGHQFINFVQLFIRVSTLN